MDVFNTVMAASRLDDIDTADNDTMTPLVEGGLRWTERIKGSIARGRKTKGAPHTYRES